MITGITAGSFYVQFGLALILFHDHSTMGGQLWVEMWVTVQVNQPLGEPELVCSEQQYTCSFRLELNAHLPKNSSFTSKSSVH